MRVRLIGLILAIGLALPAAPSLHAWTGLQAWTSAASAGVLHHGDAQPCRDRQHSPDTAPAPQADTTACCIAGTALILPAPDRSQHGLPLLQIGWRLPSDAVPDDRPPGLDPHPPRL